MTLDFFERFYKSKINYYKLDSENERSDGSKLFGAYLVSMTDLVTFIQVQFKIKSTLLYFLILS